jgi:hypothetical protein
MRAPPVPSFRRRWAPIIGAAWRRAQQQRKPVPALFLPRHRLLSPALLPATHRLPKGARPPLAPLSAQLRAARKAAKRPPHPNRVLAHLRMLRLLAMAKAAKAADAAPSRPDDRGLAAFEEALQTHPDAQAFLADHAAAVRLYRALCNRAWAGPDGRVLTVSWRAAGGIVADARGKGEDYLDFYCSGGEGQVAADVQFLLGALGWAPCPYPA